MNVDSGEEITVEYYSNKKNIRQVDNMPFSTILYIVGTIIVLIFKILPGDTYHLNEEGGMMKGEKNEESVLMGGDGSPFDDTNRFYNILNNEILWDRAVENIVYTVNGKILSLKLLNIDKKKQMFNTTPEYSKFKTVGDVEDQYTLFFIDNKKNKYLHHSKRDNVDNFYMVTPKNIVYVFDINENDFKKYDNANDYMKRNIAGFINKISSPGQMTRNFFSDIKEKISNGYNEYVNITKGNKGYIGATTDIIKQLLINLKDMVVGLANLATGSKLSALITTLTGTLALGSLAYYQSDELKNKVGSAFEKIGKALPMFESGKQFISNVYTKFIGIITRFFRKIGDITGISKFTQVADSLPETIPDYPLPTVSADAEVGEIRESPTPSIENTVATKNNFG